MYTICHISCIYKYTTHFKLRCNSHHHTNSTQTRNTIAMSIEPSVRERSVSGDAAPEISRLIGMSTLVNMHVLLSTTSGAIDRVLGNDSSDDDSKTD